MAKKSCRSKKPRSKRDWLNLRERIIKPWRLAIFKLRGQLANECLSYPAERRCFQKDRLFENLFIEIEKPRTVVRAYWLFCGSPWENQLGYQAAREQHYAELKASGLSPELRPGDSAQAAVAELLFRVHSIATWIEAQESWVLWKHLNQHPAAWDRDDPQARRQALDAAIIASLRSITGGLSNFAITRMVESFGKWDNSQWVRILKTAASVAGKPQKPISELETWVWWRYPIFSRHRWSAGEVCRAAKEKFGEVEQVDNQPAFQSAWVRRGLRFAGKRTRRNRPPFWDFVINEKVPKDVPSECPMLT